MKARSLLKRGFFPRDLPPVFSSTVFGKKYSALSKIALATGKWAHNEGFDLPRGRAGRRTAAIVNPVPFFGLAELIAKHWHKLRKLYKRSPFSFSAPRFSAGPRAITDSDFRGFRDSPLTRGAGYSFVLHADFARFFPTIYTHAVEWAIRGKDKSKASLKKKTKQLHWARAIDKQLQAMQDGQTQGIPIGPDTSYIVSELVASAIDRRFTKLLRKRPLGARLIDDYLLFFETHGAAEMAQVALASAAAEYQVALNVDKTRIEPIVSESRESWTYSIGDFHFSSGVAEQRRSLIRYCEHVIAVFAKHQHPAIGRYAIKVFSKQVIHPQNIDVALGCVLRIASISPSAMPDVASFVVSYHRLGYAFAAEPVRVFLRTQLVRALDLGFDLEASWALWIAIELGISLPKDVCQRLSRSDSSVVLLLGKLAESKGLAKSVKQQVFGSPLTADDFLSSNWLLAYEGAMRGWFGWSPADIVGSTLEPLAQEGIYFLDVSAKTSLAVKAKKKFDVRQLLSLDFEDLEDFFEAEVDEGGYDLASTKLPEDPADNDEEDLDPND